MIIAGIDLSLRGTGIFINNLTTNKTYFYYFTKNKKDLNHQSVFIPDSLDQEKTIDKVISFLKEVLRNHKVTYVCLEAPIGSAYFEWMDLYGILKHSLRVMEIEYIKASPPALKKYATGSGSAKKPQMGYALRQEFDLDFDYLGEEANNVVDAAWCCDVIKNYIEVRDCNGLFPTLPEQKQDLIGQLTGLKVKPKKIRKKKDKSLC